ncbi:MAG: flagellar motor protein MotB, partial [Rhizobacter sp.]|nr:flagellar motor protein MotB [Rhizobacter sp.]
MNLLFPGIPEPTRRLAACLFFATIIAQGLVGCAVQQRPAMRLPSGVAQTVSSGAASATSATSPTSTNDAATLSAASVAASPDRPKGRTSTGVAANDMHDLPTLAPPPPPELVPLPVPALGSQLSAPSLSRSQSQSQSLSQSQSQLGPSEQRVTNSTAATTEAAPAGLPFDAAVIESLDEVFGGLPSTSSLFGAFDSPGAAKDRIGVVLLPIVHGRSGRRSLATSRAELLIVERAAARFKHIELLPFTAAGLGAARYVLAVNVARTSAEPHEVPYRLAFALIDMGAARVVASASAVARIEAPVSLQPLPFDRDRPVGFRDGFVDGVVRATSASAAVDAAFLARLPAMAPTFEAIRLYDLGRYDESLAGFRFAMATPPGDLRLLSVLYLAYWRLGRDVEAEQMFGKIMQTGLQTRQWSLMLQDGQITPRQVAAEQMWLSQVATQALVSRVCLAVIGN